MTIPLAQPVAQASSGAFSANSATVTLGSLTTQRNCLVACIGGYHVGTVTSVTSAASPTGWVSAAVLDVTGVTCEIWICPGITTGAATVTAQATNAGQMGVTVFELAGVMASSPLDASAPGGSVPSPTVTSWSSGTSSAYQAGDVLIGLCASSRGTAGYTLTGPSSPWVNETAINTSLSGISSRFLAGYQITTGGGTMTYAGTSSTYQEYSCVAIALKSATPAGGSTGGSFLPFFA